MDGTSQQGVYAPAAEGGLHHMDEKTQCEHMHGSLEAQLLCRMGDAASKSLQKPVEQTKRCRHAIYSGATSHA